MYIKDDQFRIYKVNCETLEKGIEEIHRYETHIYDLYGGDTWTDMDTWGWWNYCEYEEVDYNSISNDDEIYDLVDYKYDYPEEFCKSYYKGEIK